MQDTAGRTPLHMAAAYGAHPTPKPYTMTP
jgi:hypothetical protein